MRPLETKDAPVINAAIKHSIKDLQPFMDWSHQEISVERQLDRIQRSQIAFSLYEEFDFAVFDQWTDEFVMSASLSKPRAPNAKALAIGYWTSSKHSNKGIATIITKVLIVLAFEFMGCDRLEIACNKSNEKSLSVIRKTGFKFEGNAPNYFSKPTFDMIQNNYTKDRTGLLYALLPEEAQSLSWYNTVKSKILVTSK